MAIWMGAHPRNFHAGRNGRRPEAIVIHVMDGSLAGTDAWFNNPASRVSAHYGIGKDGQVHQYVRESDAAFHVGTVDRPIWPGIRREQGKVINPNLYTIGIEHEGRGASLALWPGKMRAASLALAADIARRWSIPIDELHIIPHSAIRRSKPDCPGKGIDLDAYISELRGHFRTGAVAARAPVCGNHPHRSQAQRARRAQHPGSGPPPAPRRRHLRRGRDRGRRDRHGNASWYRSAAGEHIWAGNTDQPFRRDRRRVQPLGQFA